MSKFTIKSFEPLLAQIENETLRQQVLDVYEEIMAQSEFERFEDVPMVHKDHSKWNCQLVEHETNTTTAALAVAECVEKAYGIKLDKDILIAGDLLHDGSKPLEYWKSETDVGHTKLMDQVGHSMIAANVAYNHGMPKEVVHIILSHTPYYKMPNASIESLLVYYTDVLDGEVRRNLVNLAVKAKKTVM